MNELAIPERVTELEKLSNVRLELAEAKSLPEINKVIQQAQAMREGMLRAKSALLAAKGLEWAEEAIRQSAEIAAEAGVINLEAQAKAGGILREMAESGERQTPGGDRKSSHQADAMIPALDDLGIPKSSAQRWQQVERVPPAIRQEYVDTAKMVGGDVTRGGLLEYAQRTGHDVPPAEKTDIHLHAERVIRRLLKDGPMESKEFKRTLRSEGVSDHGLDLAKKSLNVVPDRTGGAATVWKFADPEEYIPRMGPKNDGWECPNCGGYGWVEDKPKFRNPRGVKRTAELERRKAREAQRNGEDSVQAAS